MLGITFGEMTKAKDFQTIIEKAKTDSKLPHSLWNAARAALGSPVIADAEVGQVAELQMFYPEFLRHKKVLHGLERILGAPSLQQLAEDCAKYATTQ